MPPRPSAFARRIIARAPLVGLTVALIACGGERAGERAPDATQALPSEFDADTAFARVERQVAFGPRVPGTAGHRAMGDWLVAALRARADTVLVQEWTHKTSDGQRLPMRNILARFRPADARRVLYLAHWDTRPTAERDADRSKVHTPIPGANDGGSGVAILLGVADALRARAPSVGVDLLFVDGEDWGSFETNTDVLIGATYFADHLPSPGYSPMLGVLWDMVGDAAPVFLQETWSAQGAPEVLQRVWSVAAERGHGAVFTNRGGYEITDDHLPLQRKGLRVIDVIDLDYPWHHSTEDTPDKVSRRTLGIVGDVAVAVIRAVEAP